MSKSKLRYGDIRDIFFKKLQGYIIDAKEELKVYVRLNIFFKRLSWENSSSPPRNFYKKRFTFNKFIIYFFYLPILENEK